MQIQSLTLDELADIFEHNQQSIVRLKEISGTIVYQIENVTGKAILINSPCDNFLIIP